MWQLNSWFSFSSWEAGSTVKDILRKTGRIECSTGVVCQTRNAWEQIPFLPFGACHCACSYKDSYISWDHVRVYRLADSAAVLVSVESAIERLQGKAFMHVLQRHGKFTSLQYYCIGVELTGGTSHLSQLQLINLLIAQTNIQILYHSKN